MKVDANPWSSKPPAKLAATGNIVYARTNRRSRIASTTPLHSACIAGSYEMVVLLLDHGAFVNAATDEGKTPLMLAVESDDTNLVYLLLARNAKVDARLPESNVSLAHIATEKGNLETMQVLYQHGVDIGIRTSDQRTPREYLTKCRDVTKRKALEDWYRNISIKKRQQARALYERNRERDEQLAMQQTQEYYRLHQVSQPPQHDQMALIRQLSPPVTSFDPMYDTFPEAPPAYVAGPSAPARLAARAPVYRPTD